MTPKPEIPQYAHGEPIATSLARHSAWIESGMPHDSKCFVCSEDVEVEDLFCKTCKRSYHEPCKPVESYRIDDHNADSWFCDVCVGRNWHRNEPSLRTAALPAADAVAPTDTQPDDKSTNGSKNVAGTKRRAASSPERRPSARKSRYSTLPKYVDQALRTLYSELETSAELQSQLESMGEETIQLRRELDLCKNELSVAQRVATIARFSQTELVELRRDAAEGRAALAENAPLRESNVQLQKDVDEMRGELDAMKDVLRNWKMSLTGLVND